MSARTSVSPRGWPISWLSGFGPPTPCIAITLDHGATLWTLDRRLAAAARSIGAKAELL